MISIPTYSTYLLGRVSDLMQENSSLEGRVRDLEVLLRRAQDGCDYTFDRLEDAEAKIDDLNLELSMFEDLARKDPHFSILANKLAKSCEEISRLEEITAKQNAEISDLFAALRVANSATESLRVKASDYAYELELSEDSASFNWTRAKNAEAKADYLADKLRMAEQECDYLRTLLDDLDCDGRDLP